MQPRCTDYTELNECTLYYFPVFVDEDEKNGSMTKLPALGMELDQHWTVKLI